jgi:MSHA type pilus biogenesis protein MshL
MKSKSFTRKTAITSAFALMAFLPVSACDLTHNFTKMDRSSNSEFQDYRDAMAPREAPSSAASDGQNDGGIPDLEAYVSDSKLGLKSAPLVSLSINQSIPLREALFELAKQADYDIELDPRISGSIIFTARNRPLDEVIDRICEISGLRYKFSDNSLRIEIDSPYTKNYKIDYLSFVRKVESSIKTDVSVASSGDAQVGGGSKYSMDSLNTSDFWAELDLNIKQILSSNATPSYLKTAEDPVISLTSSNPVVPPVDGSALADTAPQAGDEYISVPQLIIQEASATAVPSPTMVAPATPTAPATSPVPPTDASLLPTTTATPPASQTASPTLATPAAADPSATPSPQPVSAAPVVPAQPPVLRVESLPTSASGGANGGANAVQFTPAYSINKQAGIVSVYANERLHRQIESYLSDLRRASTSQVLIEAKVLEVTLTDEFAAGIDWRMLNTFGDIALRGDFSGPNFTPGAASSVSLGITGDDLTTFVDALSRFGTVHALASPRLTVINNQSALLSVARNQVYFELDVQSDTTAGTTTTTTTTVESEIKTVPEGVLINVMPSIDLSNRTISLQVRPTITKIVDQVVDPGVAFVASSANIDIESRIPVMNVQEFDSVVKMRNKEMMVMGGLLQDETRSTQEGLPVAGEIPLFGTLFRNQGDKVSKKELVVFIKATIIDSPADTIHQTDRDLYRTFGQDRRPEKM